MRLALRALTLLLIAHQSLAQRLKEDAEDDIDVAKAQEKLSFQPPKLTEEEEFSPFLTKELLCDGCTAVGYQLHKAFELAEERQGRKLKESDIIAATEKVCRPKTFEQYGIAETDNGRKRLKGEGVWEEPGIAQLGGKLPLRLREHCLMLLELEDTEIYEQWLKNGKSSEGLRTFLCEKTFKYCKQSKYEL